MSPLLHRIFPLGLLLVLVAGATVRSGQTDPVRPAPSASSAACLYQTADEWQRFLQRSADNEDWVKTCEDNACDEEYYEYVKRNIQDVLDACAGYLAAHPALARCTDNLRRYTPAWMRQHDETSYGFNVDNHTYLSAQEAVDKPAGMMRPPEAIVAALPYRDRVEQAARSNGLEYLTHDSALGGYRTFVFVPDPAGRFDQWMLLNLKNGEAEVSQNTPMSIIVVQKKDAAGRPLPRGMRLHFRDYTIEKDEGDELTYRLKLHESNNGKCYACHANGVRQLIPRRTPILESKPSRGEASDDAGNGDFAYQRLIEFNKRLRSYGSPDWDGTITPADHGPALGKAMGCVECHDGKTRGILNGSFSHDQLRRKLFSELSMSPDLNLVRLLERKQMKNPQLLPDEEAALQRAFDAHQKQTAEFEESRFPELRRWLLETPCM
jgi:hypothetical protein